MENGWKEAKQRSIHLEEDKPETFKVYMYWLYRGIISVRHGQLTEEDIQPDYLRLAKSTVWEINSRMRSLSTLSWMHCSMNWMDAGFLERRPFITYITIPLTLRNQGAF